MLKKEAFSHSLEPQFYEKNVDGFMNSFKSCTQDLHKHSFHSVGSVSRTTNGEAASLADAFISSFETRNSIKVFIFGIKSQKTFENASNWSHKKSTNFLLLGNKIYHPELSYYFFILQQLSS